jgi:hypothetical protein
LIDREFEHTIDHIKDVLEDMAEILKEIVRHTKINHESGRQELRAILNNHMEDTTFSMTKNLAARFMFAKSESSRRELFKRMGDNIKLLERLNKGQAQIKQFVAAGVSTDSHTPFLDKVRIHSNSLYDALSGISQCNSHKSHGAMLRLERRETPDSKADRVRFSLILKYEQSLGDGQDLWMTEVCIKERYPSRRSLF